MFTLFAITLDLAGEAQKQGLSYAAPGQDIGTFMQTVLSGILIIGALAVLLFLVWGSVEWILSGGEKAKIETARNKITGAVAGFIVLSVSLVIFGIVQQIFHLHVVSFM